MQTCTDHGLTPEVVSSIKHCLKEPAASCGSPMEQLELDALTAEPRLCTAIDHNNTLHYRVDSKNRVVIFTFTSLPDQRPTASAGDSVLIVRCDKFDATSGQPKFKTPRFMLMPLVSHGTTAMAGDSTKADQIASSIDLKERSGPYKIVADAHLPHVLHRVFVNAPTARLSAALRGADPHSAIFASSLVAPSQQSCGQMVYKNQNEVWVKSVVDGNLCVQVSTPGLGGDGWYWLVDTRSMVNSTCPAGANKEEFVKQNFVDKCGVDKVFGELKELSNTKNEEYLKLFENDGVTRAFPLEETGPLVSFFEVIPVPGVLAQAHFRSG